MVTSLLKKKLPHRTDNKNMGLGKPQSEDKFSIKGEKGLLYYKQMKGCFFNRQMNRIIIISLLGFLIIPCVVLILFFHF